MADLLINGKDALTTWGVSMGKDFLNAIGSSAPLKGFIENKSRMEHGKRVVLNNPKLDERELTLSFTIKGASASDYQVKKKSFFDELYKGGITIQIPDNGNELYHLIYTGKNISYGQNLKRTFGKISCKFIEPNPAKRV